MTDDFDYTVDDLRRRYPDRPRPRLAARLIATALYALVPALRRPHPVDQTDPTVLEFQKAGLTPEQITIALELLPHMRTLDLEHDDAILLLAAANAYFGTDALPMAFAYTRQVLSIERNHHQ